METQMGCNFTITSRLVKPACIQTVYIPIGNVRKGLGFKVEEGTITVEITFMDISVLGSQ